MALRTDGYVGVSFINSQAGLKLDYFTGLCGDQLDTAAPEFDTKHLHGRVACGVVVMWDHVSCSNHTRDLSCGLGRLFQCSVASGRAADGEQREIGFDIQSH